MASRPALTWFAAILGILSWGGCGTSGGSAARPEGAPDLTNVHLIASMPPGTESVLVMHPDKIREGSPFWWLASHDLTNRRDPGAEAPPPDIYRTALAAAEKAGITAHALGASRFVPPYDMGAGDFRQCSVWTTRRPIAGLDALLAPGGGVPDLGAQSSTDGIPVYQGRVTRYAYGLPAEEQFTENIHIALPDPCTMVAAECREDLDFVVRALRGRAAEVPAWWASAAGGVDVEAPLVVLRRFDPESQEDILSPVNPRHSAANRVRFDSFALSAADPAAFEFRVRAIAGEADRALAWCQEVGSSDVQWQTQPTPDGFEGLMFFRPDAAEPEIAPLVVLMLFGVIIAI